MQLASVAVTLARASVAELSLFSFLPRLAEMGIIRNGRGLELARFAGGSLARSLFLAGITSNNTDLTEFKRNTATASPSISGLALE